MDYPIISGVLDNEAMFASTDITDPTLKHFYALNFRFTPQNDWTDGSLEINAVNVNDPPMLVKEFGTQYIKIGDNYTYDMNTYVRDPDRKEVFYTFENMPSGGRGFSDGRLGLNISTKGTYSIKVTATDVSGEALSFTITFIANKTGREPSKSSGGGSILWLLLILPIYFRGNGSNRKLN